MRTFFIDTNVLLQCRELKELSWHELAGVDDVLVLISRPVQEEIDDLMHGGNARRTRRARSATTLIRALILAEPSRVVLRESSPRVEVSRLALAFKLEEPPCRLLDLSRIDDRIIAEALQYRDHHPNEAVALLTHDTQPLGTAKDCGLPAVVVPDNWLLPPEPDDRDKRIAELERRLRNLERSDPEIQVDVKNKAGEPIRVLTIIVHQYASISPEQLDELLAIAAKIYPLTTEFDTSEPQKERALDLFSLVFGQSFCYEPPTQEEITSYQEEQYPQWLNRIKEFFQTLTTRLEAPSRHAHLSITINNLGAAPPEHVMLEFEARGDILLVPSSPSDANQPAALLMPPAPEPPKGKWVRRRTALDVMTDNLRYQPPILNVPELRVPRIEIPAPRERHAFYWQTTKKWARFLACECEEFRHRVGPETFEITLFAPPGEAADECSLGCRITARNISEPVLLELPVRITYEKMDSLSVARTLIRRTAETAHSHDGLAALPKPKPRKE